MDRTKTSPESARDAKERLLGLKRADAQASCMGSRTKPQVRCASGDNSSLGCSQIRPGSGSFAGRVLCQMTSRLTWVCRICIRVPPSSPVVAVVFEAQLKALGPSDCRAQRSRNSVPPAQVYNVEDIHSGGSSRSSEERT